MMYLKCVVAQSGDHVLEEDLRGESVPVVDNWLSVRSVPAVHLHTPTSTFQCTVTHVHKSAHFIVS